MHFDFKFYKERPQGGPNVNHEDAFKSQLVSKGISFGTKLDELKRNGISIGETDYLIHALFKDKNRHRLGYRNLNDLQRTVVTEIRRFRDFFDFSKTVNNNLTKAEGGSNRNYTDYMGVAGALTATNRLFNLTNADYDPIPEDNKRKTLDFNTHVASLGDRFIVVECKGLSGIKSSTWEAAQDIMAKKGNANSPVKRDIYFGIIVQIPYKNEPENARLTLVDPEIPDLPEDAKKQKLISRLRFYSALLEMFYYPRLIERLDTIVDYLKNTKEKDWENTFDRMMDAIRYPYRRNYFHPNYFWRTSISLRDSDFRFSAVCFVIPVDGNEFFVYGILDNVVDYFVQAGPEKIIEMYFGEDEVFFNEHEIRYHPPGEAGKRSLKITGKLKIYSSGEVAGVVYGKHINEKE